MDPNDSNSNGIPDLSDDPGALPPRRPQLALDLNRASLTLLLSISGELGKTYDLEQSVSLLPAVWTKISSIVLASDPQAVSLPVPTNSSRFYRVRVL